MHNVRCGHVLYERKQNGTHGIGTEKCDAFREAITVYIGLGGGERHGIDI